MSVDFENASSVYTTINGFHKKVNKVFKTINGVWKLVYESFPEFVITYNANGGTFTNESNTNAVRYLISIQSENITKISKTNNVSDDGLTSDDSTGYGNNVSTNDVIKIDGAESLEVVITYATESTSWDWVCIYNNNITPTTSNYGNSISGKLGGTTKTTKTFTVDGDTVQIYFRSDSSNCNYYGYYAVVSGIGNIVIPSIISGIEKTPIKDGCTFGGWYLNPECSDGNELDLTNISSNSTVYAKWNINLDEDLLLSLIDFEYVNNQDGTVTLTAWKGTLNGESSTELVIPDDPRIIL